MGIDVGGARKGYHVVALDAARRFAGEPQQVPDAAALGPLMAALRPDVIAIDAPCGWSAAKSRLAERALARAGIRSFCTPSRERAADVPGFYGWMFNGEAAFGVATRELPLFVGGSSVAGHTFEVFPNATAHRLRGPQPKSVSKVAWRRALLRDAGVDEAALGNLDLVDAAICALTGLLALEGDFETFGQVGEGFLIAPRER